MILSPWHDSGMMRIGRKWVKMMGFWIGIDIGTSGVKSILINKAQSVIAESTAPLEVSRPHPGWSEQNPEDWADAVMATMDALAASHPTEMAAVEGIGLSGQMHGATLLDAADRVLRPAILWNDGRSGAECAVLDQRADFRGIGGNLVMPGFTAPKLEWVRRHEPEIFAKVARVLLPKDYVRLKLSGEYLSDMSDSAGTLWMDVGARMWSPALLAATGLDVDAMPDLIEGAAPGGQLRADLVQRWGMTAAPVIAGGGGDNAASAAGVGAISPGNGFLSLGTSGVLFVSGASYSPNTDHAVHAFCHAVPETWHQMGVILSATDALNWLSGITGKPPAELSDVAAAAPVDHGVIVHPYFSGERTPHNDPGARGGIFGLAHTSDTGVLARAMMEGVGFAFADCAASLQAAGNQIGPVYALGGGARSPFWLQMIADITGLTLLIPEKGDFGAAFGAARLAMVASGAGDVSTVLTPAPVAATVTPSQAETERYQQQLARYRSLYPAVRD